MEKSETTDNRLPNSSRHNSEELAWDSDSQTSNRSSRRTIAIPSPATLTDVTTISPNCSESARLRSQLRQGELLVVNPRRKNGLIIYKTYHAEFAGPGAIIGGNFDRDASRLLAVGNLALITPQNSQARKQAYKMRRQWVRLTKQIIDNPQPTERAQVILNQFEHWFDAATVAGLPDEAFALLVGVLPQTIRKVRNIELL